MNNLHGIKLDNDRAAARGKILNYNKASNQLRLNGEPIGPVFLNRKGALAWAKENKAVVL
jgi:hypothetical protein